MHTQARCSRKFIHINVFMLTPWQIEIAYQKSGTVVRESTCFPAFLTISLHVTKEWLKDPPLTD